MQTISATEAKNYLASVMDKAIREPVLIEKNGRPFVVMMSVEEYEKKAGQEKTERERKKAFLEFCDYIATTAKKNGMTEEILNSILAEEK